MKVNTFGMESKKNGRFQVLGKFLDSLVSCLSLITGLDGETLDRRHFRASVVVFHSRFIIMLKWPHSCKEKKSMFISETFI